MAKRNIVFDYYSILSEGSGIIEGKCNLCHTTIRGKIGVTSNFLTHLKRKHISTYDELLKRKEVSMNVARDPNQLTLTELSSCSTSQQKFDKNDPRQKAITRSIVLMIVKDLQPAYIVEREGFRDLITLLEPRYVLVSRKHLQQNLIPSYHSKVEDTIKQFLGSVNSCCITLDIWSSRRMQSYLGVTCHFISDQWEIKSLLLSCQQLTDRHTSENILSEFEEVVQRYNISDKVYRVVTDNASNMKKAFEDTVHLPDFDVEIEEENIEDAMIEDIDEDLESSDISESLNLDLVRIPQRVPCFAHTLQLCINDGLKACSGISGVLAKAGRIVNHVKKSTIATGRMEEVFGKTLISKNETRWNSQLKMIRRLVEMEMEKVVEKREFTLNSYEKAVLRELVEVLEPFEEATDMLQGEKYNSISLVIPCFLGLKDHLLQINTRYSLPLVTALKSSLDRRLGSVLDNSLYICSTILDPQFKLRWSKNTEVHMKVLQDEAMKLTTLSDTESSEEEPPVAKKSKLFSFMAVPSKSRTKRSSEEEIRVYLSDTQNSLTALEYWKLQAKEYPVLSELASNF